MCAGRDDSEGSATGNGNAREHTRKFAGHIDSRQPAEDQRKVRRLARELTPELLRLFIQKIVVYKKIPRQETSVRFLPGYLPELAPIRAHPVLRRGFPHSFWQRYTSLIIATQNLSPNRSGKQWSNFLQRVASERQKRKNFLPEAGGKFPGRKRFDYVNSHKQT